MHNITLKILKTTTDVDMNNLDCLSPVFQLHLIDNMT